MLSTVLFLLTLILGNAASTWAEQRPGQYELPFRFEENRGQADADVRYIARAAGYSAHFTDRDVVVYGGKQPIRMRFSGSNSQVRLYALDEMTARTHWLAANLDRSFDELRNYKRLVYENVYPGIDIVFRDTGRQLEFDFIVKPGADPGVIGLNFTGQDRLDVTPEGEAVLTTDSGKLRLHAPFIYQDTADGRRPIEGRYIRAGKADVRLLLKNYDVAQTLVIDPVLVFSTYFGGSGRENITDIAMDPSNNAYVAFQVFREGDASGPTMWLVKFNAFGEAAYILHGYGVADWYFASQEGVALAAGTDGSLAMLMKTAIFFPGHPGYFQPTSKALPPSGTNPGDFALIKIDPAGHPVYSTFLGLKSSQYGRPSVAMDAQGNIYAFGAPASGTMPIVNGYQPAPGGGSDAYILKINPSATQILYASYLGGSGDDYPAQVAIDSSGNMVLSGETTSTDFPLRNAFQTQGGTFVTKLNPAGSALVFSTRLTTGSDAGMDLDPSGNIYIGGNSSSAGSITKTIYPGGGFIAKITPTGTVAFTYAVPQVRDIAVDTDGSMYVAGTAPYAQKDFPVLNSFRQAGDGFGGDLYVLKLTSHGEIDYSTLLSGTTTDPGPAGEASSYDEADVIEVDSQHRAFVAGISTGYDFPTTNGTHRSALNITSGHDAVLLVLGPDSGADTSPRYSRLEETYSQVQFTGTWYTQNSTTAGHSASAAKLAMSAGDKFSVSFTGATTLKWYGCKDQYAGIAKVYLDGTLRGTIDTYASAGACHQVIWSMFGIPPGSHVFTVEVTGTKSYISKAKWVWLDSIEFVSAGDMKFGTAPPPPNGGSTGGNTGTGASAWTRIQQTSTAIQYTGTWYNHSGSFHSGGTAALALSGKAAFTFTGTGARWIGLKDAYAGIAKVYVDGALKQSVDTYSTITYGNSVLFSIEGLPSGNHTLTIEATGTRNASSKSSWVWVDAFESIGGSTTGTGGSGGSTGGSTPETFTRIEQSNSAVQFTGTWYNQNSAMHSGGSSALALAGRATFTFTGTAAKWVGLKDGYSGIAKVYVDGVLQQSIDTYSTTTQAKTVLFKVEGLPVGAHTLAVEATGTRSPSSKANWIWVDAFEFTGSAAGGTTGTYTRVEQTDGAVQKTGTWNSHNSTMHSGGSAILSISAGARVVFSFTGTAVQWLGLKDPWSGIAKVYVDGALKGEVDLYSAAAQSKSVLFTIEALTVGSHTIAIEATGRRNTAASAAWVWVDAFEYR